MITVDVVMGLVRHALTTGGAYLATKGFIADSDVQPLVGAVLIIVGIMWSVINKRRG